MGHPRVVRAFFFEAGRVVGLSDRVDELENHKSSALVESYPSAQNALGWAPLVRGVFQECMGPSLRSG